MAQCVAHLCSILADKKCGRNEEAGAETASAESAAEAIQDDDVGSGFSDSVGTELRE